MFGSLTTTFMRHLFYFPHKVNLRNMYLKIARRMFNGDRWKFRHSLYPLFSHIEWQRPRSFLSITSIYFIFGHVSVQTNAINPPHCALRGSENREPEKIDLFSGTKLITAFNLWHEHEFHSDTVFLTRAFRLVHFFLHPLFKRTMVELASWIACRWHRSLPALIPAAHTLFEWGFPPCAFEQKFIYIF